MTDLEVNILSTGFMCILYIVLGCIVCSFKILNILLYCSKKTLFNKYTYMVALEVGDFVNGISYVYCGLGRGLGLWYGYIREPTTLYDCFFGHYWVFLLILGTELPAFCIILISFERVLAVVRPVTFMKLFDGRSKYLILSLVPILGLISICVAGISAFQDGERVVSTRHCPIISSTSIWFATYHFCMITVVYIFTFTALGIVKFKVHKMISGSSYDNRITMMMVITGASLLLVGSSAVVMLIIRYDIMHISDTIVGITYSMPGILSIVNSVANLAFLSELKHQLYRKLGMHADSKHILGSTFAHHTTHS
ncbi:unnamed protein product [Auanema sp. JU1783]|nr:unnamed protein product [Auanema sp. JU1783]